VIVNHGRAALVEDAEGEMHRCAARRSLPRTVAGDRVQWTSTGRREGVITALEPRQSVLLRPQGPKQIRPVAANVNQVIVVLAVRPSFQDALLDRYLAAAELIGARPLVLINKADLLDAAGRYKLEQRMQPFERIGYEIRFTSPRTTDGLKDLHSLLREHISILVGQSGVGKSSLVQAVLPDLEIRTGDLSEATGLGRHTTTAATLYHLPDGGDLIDSPGVRDFSLWTREPEEVARGFREFRPFLGGCRFHNCRHLSEPGCALADAARQGEIDSRRLESYRAILSGP
jgi:ribosome biogenesis GTPase